MEPEHYKFGGGATQTMLHPIVLIATVIAILMIFVLPRKYIIVPVLVGAFLIPAGQQIVVAGIHIFILRLIIFGGWLRLIRDGFSRQQQAFAGGWNFIDKAFLLFVLCHAVAFTILYCEFAAVVNQLGFLWDYVGGYFLLRYTIRDLADINNVIKCFTFLALVLAICMIGEQLTGEDVFGRLGGVAMISEVRNGRIRSQAVFQHAILAGSFGATFLPLCAWLWHGVRLRFIAVLGAFAATAMVVTSACSTPVLGYVAAVLAVCFWPLRNSMRLVRWAAILALIALTVVMHAPVWYLIAHVGVVNGSAIYHRAELVDAFIRHFPDWWLLGTDANGSWGYLLFDTANQYVNEGITGGLAALIFFLLTISRAFSRLGKARESIFRQGNGRAREWLIWLLGSALFANVMTFFGISYFDQMKLLWFAFLAMISAATAPLLQAKSVSAPQVETWHAGNAQFVQLRG